MGDMDHNNVETALVPVISSHRDNVAHIITHEVHHQKEHWSLFATQQGSGDFDPDEDDDDDEEDDDGALSSHDSHASDLVPLAYRSDSCKTSETANKKQKVGQPAKVVYKVHRYALARDPEKQRAVQASETTLYSNFLSQASPCTSTWEVVDKITGSAGASSSMS